MQEEILSTQQETDRIVQLLLSENEESILLGIHLIEAIGMNRRLMSYVMVYSLYSSDENICIAAFDVFSQCASDNLKRHVYQKWDRRKLSDAAYSSELFTHDAIDSFDCVVAFHHCWQMYSIDNVTYNCINEHVLSERRYQEDFDDNTIGYFVLNDFENIEVNSSILELKFLSNINICNIQNIDIQYFIKVIFERESIFEYSFLNMNIEQNIDALFQIPHLRSLAFIKSKVKTLPAVINAPHLTSLNFFKITDFQIFPDLSTCSGLVELSINHCEIVEILCYAAHKKLQYLDLSNNQIEYLPREICFLRKLDTLKLDNNKIKNIDKEIKLFLQSSVTLHHNLLQKIHCDFKQKDIDLSHNQLTEFPSHLLKDAQRETINVSCNEISTFEFDSTLEDSKLKSLYLDNNQLSSLPDGLEQFVYLEKLDFSKNRLTSIPVALFSHQKLENFYFSHNKIEFVPNDLSKMRNLAYLNFQSNQIKALPMMLPIGIKSCHYQNNPVPKEDADIFELLFPESNGLPF